MVDASDYVDGRTIRFDLLASTMLASLILSVYGTAAGIITELASLPALVISTVFESITTVLTTTLAQPTHSLQLAWLEATRSLPEVGPLTLTIALVLIAVTWLVQLWVIDRIRGGL